MHSGVSRPSRLPRGLIRPPDAAAVGQVPANRLLADEQCLGGLLVAGSRGRERQYVRLALGQPAGKSAAVEPADIRQGTEFAIDRQRGRGIRGGDAGLSQPAVRLGEQFVDSGCVVAGVQAPVLVDDGMQHGQGLGVLRLCYKHGGPSLPGPGAEAGGGENGCGFLQPGAEPLGLIKVPES